MTEWGDGGVCIYVDGFKGSFFWDKSETTKHLCKEGERDVGFCIVVKDFMFSLFG